MSFRDEVEIYFDAEGFIGRKPNPSIREDGNPATTLGIWAVILKQQNEIQDKDKAKLNSCLDKLYAGAPGLYHKKPGTTDRLTFDDLIGIVAASTAFKYVDHFNIYKYGESHGWRFTNDPSQGIHFTDFAKPWHIAFYKLAAYITPSIWELISLFIHILVNAYTKKDDASGKILKWLMINSIKGRSKLIDLSSYIWEQRIKKVYGSPRRLFIMYFGESHPFSRYAM